MGVVDKLGYDYEIVEQQKYPNPDFPGLSTPNPEDSAAMKLAIDMAVQKKADIAFGTDPDSDRFGAAIPNEKGEYVLLTGNQVGCIITDYLLRSRKKKGLLQASDYIIRSFVSTHIVDEMAARFGIECAVVPTGFKHFSDLVHNKYTNRHFIFGFEESCGYMEGYKVADKDGMLAAALMLEVMCECRRKGVSMYEHLTELFEEYGWYKENVVSVYHEEDPNKSKRIMDEIRNSPPKEVAGQMVMGIKDHLETEDQNMITFTLEKGWLSIRPSGTEPKIKLYYGVNEKTNSASEALLESIDKGVQELIGSWK
jgi:phosphoglucomutase